MTDVQVVSWGEIDGREITFPMEVTDFNAATVMWTVPSAAAAALLPGDAFEIAESAPGTTQFVLAACDYVANPWGDYDELNLGFLVRPASDPERVGSFVYRMPVNQEFTREAGNRVMGFPKTVEGIDVTYTDTHASFRLTFEGEHAFTLTVPRAAPLGPTERIETESFSYLDGVAHATPLSMDMGTGFVDPADVVLELGTGKVADELASLGLPGTPPDMCAWGEGLSATFQLGQPI